MGQQHWIRIIRSWMTLEIAYISGHGFTRCNWFNNPKGYGFLAPTLDSENQPIFIHYSALQMDGFPTLQPEALVWVAWVNGPKGLHAKQVWLIDTPTKEMVMELAQLEDWPANKIQDCLNRNSLETEYDQEELNAPD